LSPNNLSIPAGANQIEQLAGSVVIITGVGRSGKTLLGNLLGTCRNVEHLDEPWLPMLLPMLAGKGAIEETLAIDMFRSSVVELFNDRLLMRHVNFRPSDLSSIWRQKSPDEIISRLIGLYSREDVRQYAGENAPTLVLNLTDTLPFSRFFSKALPGCRIIHVLRDGVDVALAIADKGWLSDGELLSPNNALPYWQFHRSSNAQSYYFPWWLEADEAEMFLGFSDFERGLMYWRRLLDLSEKQGAGTESKELLVKFSDLMERPREVLRSLLEYLGSPESLSSREPLGLPETELTQAMLSKIIPEAEKELPTSPPSGLERSNLIAAREIYKRFDLPGRRLEKPLSESAPAAH
jgi:hypothetical protein